MTAILGKCEKAAAAEVIGGGRQVPAGFARTWPEVTATPREEEQGRREGRGEDHSAGSDV